LCAQWQAIFACNRQGWVSTWNAAAEARTTQLGADIEGRRWTAPAFAAAETALKEGLAQYYTDRVLHRLERRYGGALNTFRALLPNQPVAYRTHEA